MNGLRAIIPGQDSAAEEKAAIPYSLEAEQQLLGALLTNNDVFDRVTQVIKPEHFYHPVHARIFEICSERIRKNALASPVTIKAFLENDEGLKELGGPAYLARMASAAAVFYNVSGRATCYDLPTDPNFDGIWDYLYAAAPLPLAPTTLTRTR